MRKVKMQCPMYAVEALFAHAADGRDVEFKAEALVGELIGYGWILYPPHGWDDLPLYRWMGQRALSVLHPHYGRLLVPLGAVANRGGWQLNGRRVPMRMLL